ncbi:MAG: YraN family protein [Bacillota bacterium]|nr:YraN family protein [Bacillota bacterium]
MNKREIGKEYEQAAASYLEDNGFRILERNFRCRQGEVDLVGIHQDCLVFVEVKYRKNDRAGSPEEAVNYRKQIRICKTSDYYRLIHPWHGSRQVRYDVVAICADDIRWHQNAFDYVWDGFSGRGYFA